MTDKLLLSFLALALGPLLVRLARRHAWSTVVVDSFCVVTISGFALLHLLPECVEHAGWIALPLGLLGFLAPTLAERGLHRDSPSLRRVVLGLAILGMAAHNTLDGVFLHGASHLHEGHGHTHSHDVTAWAVILHRIPEGIGIWWIVPRTLGRTAAVLITAVTVLATLLGFFLGHELEGSTRVLSLLQALLAGSLLHVVFHAHIPAPRDKQRVHLASVAGALAGGAVLWVVIHDHFPAESAYGPLQVFVGLAVESAPALLLAYLLVGLCHAFLPTGWLARMTRGNALQQALRGVAIGLPLPVCSCGVVPIYRELIRQGSSMAAAIAFLVATPELEIAAVVLTWQLLGADIAALRVAMAALLALGVGMAVGALARGHRPKPEPSAMPDAPQGTVGARLWAAVRFGYGPALDNTASWILMGLLLSALLVPYIDREWIATLPAWLDVPIAALLGLPLYVCATGSTPLAAVLLSQGLSPGAVLALLLTGPATNVTTFGMLARLHGTRIAVAFAAAMWIGTIALGYGANALLSPGTGRPLQSLVAHAHDGLGLFWLVPLGLLFGWSLLRQGVRPFLERLFESPANLAAPTDSGCCAPDDDDGAPAAAAHDHGHAHGHQHGHAHGPDCGHGEPPHHHP